MDNSVTPLTAAYVRWLSTVGLLGDARSAHTRYQAANDPQMLVHLEWDDEEGAARPAPSDLS